MSGTPGAKPQFALAHVGINTESPQRAQQAARRLCELFGFEFKEGDASIFTGSYAEVMKKSPARAPTGTSPSPPTACRTRWPISKPSGLSSRPTPRPRPWQTQKSSI